jgi:hypothetical protein
MNLNHRSFPRQREPKATQTIPVLYWVPAVAGTNGEGKAANKLNPF